MKELSPLRKIENLNLPPKHQITKISKHWEPNGLSFSEILCFSVLVAKNYFSE